MREGDHQWLNQFNAIFFVLNSPGQFIKSVAIENYKDTLWNIKRRLDKNSQQLKEFFVDNCCHWRKKIQQIFGKDTNVLLDLFHAIQRVQTKIPKKHPLHLKCCYDFLLVFRAVTDSSKE